MVQVKNKIKQIFIILATAVSLSIFFSVQHSPVAFAQSGGGSGGGSGSGKTVPKKDDPALNCVDNPSKCDLVRKYVNPIIGFLAAFVGVAVTIGIISGGIRYASAEDDPQKMAAAKRQITTALVALFAFFILYAFMQWIVPQVNK